MGWNRAKSRPNDSLRVALCHRSSDLPRPLVKFFTSSTGSRSISEEFGKLSSAESTRQPEVQFPPDSPVVALANRAARPFTRVEGLELELNQAPPFGADIGPTSPPIEGKRSQPGTNLVPEALMHR